MLKKPIFILQEITSCSWKLLFAYVEIVDSILDDREFGWC